MGRAQPGILTFATAKASFVELSQSTGLTRKKSWLALMSDLIGLSGRVLGAV